MQAATLTCAVLAAILLAVPVAAAPSGLDIHFRPPGQAGPDLHADGAQWVLLVFSNTTFASGTVDFPHAVAGTEYRQVHADWKDPVVADYPAYVPAPGTPDSYDPAHAGIGLGGRPGSLYVEAQAIRWSSQGDDAAIAHQSACLRLAVDMDRARDMAARYDALCPADGASLRIDVPAGRA